MAQPVLKLANPPAFLTRGLPPVKSLKAKRKADAKLKAAIRNQAKEGRHSDLGTPELKRHHHVVTEVRDRSSTGHAIEHGARVIDQTPLDRYFNRKELDKADPTRNYLLFQAGERLRSDFYYSGLQAHSSSSFEPRIAGGAHDKTQNLRADCLKAYKSAMKAMPETMRPIIIGVLLFDEPAHIWATRNAQLRDSGIVVLRLALAQLAHHYGLIKIEEALSAK